MLELDEKQVGRMNFLKSIYDQHTKGGRFQLTYSDPPIEAVLKLFYLSDKNYIKLSNPGVGRYEARITAFGIDIVEGRKDFE